MPRKRKPASPFRYCNSSPEVIRLVVMMYVKYPLSLRNVEDLLFERGIDICHETVRMWWNRFAREDHHRRTAFVQSSVERAGQCRQAGDRPLGQQPGREQSPTLSTTRAGDAAVSTDEDAAEVRLGPRQRPQPLHTSSIARPTRNAAWLHWPSGSRSWPEVWRSKLQFCQSETSCD